MHIQYLESIIKNTLTIKYGFVCMQDLKILCCYFKKRFSRLLS